MSTSRRSLAQLASDLLDSLDTDEDFICTPDEYDYAVANRAEYAEILLATYRSLRRVR